VELSSTGFSVNRSKVGLVESTGSKLSALVYSHSPELGSWKLYNPDSPPPARLKGVGASSPFGVTLFVDPLRPAIGVGYKLKIEPIYYAPSSRVQLRAGATEPNFGLSKGYTLKGYLLPSFMDQLMGYRPERR
jgi:hypothetical protein